MSALNLSLRPTMAPDTSNATSSDSSDDSQPTAFSKAVKALSIYDEKYATESQPAKQGVHVKARVNYFTVDLGKVPDKIFVYSFCFPPLHGRVLKNAVVKKDFIQAVLADTSLQSLKSELATDWNGTLVSFKQLEDVVGGWDYSAAVPSKTFRPTVDGHQRDISIRPIHALSKSSLQQYFNGNHVFSDDNPTDCPIWLSVLNILTRKHITSVSPRAVVKVGRDKLFPLQPARNYNNNPISWPSGLHPRSGHFSSVRPVKGNVVMNCRAVSTAFITAQTLRDFACAYIQPFGQCVTDQNYRALDSQFKSICRGLRVRLMYTPPGKDGKRSTKLQNPLQQGRPKRINAFGNSAETQQFRYGGRDISVQEYFNNHVLAPGFQLRWPQMLVANTGTQDEPSWIPTELLFIEPHQPFLRMLPDNIMQDMVKVAQHLPEENVHKIEQAFTQAGIFESKAVQHASKLVLGCKMLETSARMLGLPTLRYKGGMIEDGTAAKSDLRNGRWRLTKKMFREPGRLGLLGIIEWGPGGGSRDTYRQFAKGLASYGVNLQTNDFPLKITIPENLDLATHLSNALGKLKALRSSSGRAADLSKVVLVMLPERSLRDYAIVKAWGDTIAGISTICITMKNAHKIIDSRTRKPKINKAGQELPPPMEDAQFQGNLALKFNVKSGGVNHVLSQQAEDLLHGKDVSTMVVGADVTHPGAGSVKHCPSIAAVVASCDKSAVTYPGSMRLQESKQEMIAELDEMIADRLRLWQRKNNKKLPDNILFYRDGVSESQFREVQIHELPRIKAGCVKVGGNSYLPKITFVVCGKRHHTRFFPPARDQRTSLPSSDKCPEWAIDTKKYNWKPGFVADDTGIRSPYHFDFFLQSHMALNGTARPCHYFVIENEMNLGADKLQTITFNLCWIFATALTPISQAAPAYYADRLAERGRCYLRQLLVHNQAVGPSEQQLLANMPNRNRLTTDDEKNEYVRSRVAGGAGGLWPKQNVGPQRQELEETMFYI